MNSDGSMYMPPEMAKELEEAFGKRVEALTDAVNESSLPIDDEAIARELAMMNRKARLAFYSERRRGAGEADALEAARQTLKP